MIRKLSLLGPVAVTLAAMVAAALTAWHLWQYYTERPGPATAMCAQK